MAVANRGEVWLIDLGYVAKVRTCFILSVPVLPQDRAVMTVVPHTTSVRASRFEVSIPIRFLKPGAFDAQDLVTTSQVKLIRKLGNLTADQLKQVEDAARAWLGL